MILFAKNLKKHIDRLGWSDAEAARRCGLAERRFGNYTTGKREPDLETLVKIAGVLGTTPDELLGVRPRESRAGVQEKLDAMVATMKDGDVELLLRLAVAVQKHRSAR